MFWHIDDSIICLLFMCALCAFIYRDYVDRSRRDRTFLLCVINCIFVLAVDILSSVAMEVRIDRRLFDAAMTLYFASVMSVIVTWAYYLIELAHGSDPSKRRTAYVTMTIPYALYLLAVALNLRTGWIYSISADGVYARGPYFKFVYVYYVAYAAVLMVYIVMSFKRVRDQYQRLILLIMPLLLGIGAFVQIVVPGWLTVIPAYAFSLFISYLFIQHEHTEKLLDIKEGELQRVSEIATTDAMTGLLNHSETFARIGDFLEHDGASGTHILIMIDMDDFKKVNDTLGHQAGDEIVKQISLRLRGFFNENDIVGRIGGDEFLALKKDVDLSCDFDKRARSLLEALQFDCTDCETAVEMTVSIGIGVTHGGKSLNRLYAETDAALYKAKAAGKNCYAIAGADSAVKPFRETLSAIHLPTILEKMNGGVVLAGVGADDKINVTYVSRSYYKYLAADEALSERPPAEILEYIYPPEREAVFGAFRRTAVTGSVTEYAYRYGRRGERRHLMHAARLSLAEADGSVPVIVVITDITSLNHSLTVPDAAAVDCPTGLGIFEVEGDFVLNPIYLNETALKITAPERDQYSYRMMRDALLAVHPDDQTQIKSKLTLLQNGASAEVCYRTNPAVNNSCRLIRAKCTAVATSGGQRLLLVFFTPEPAQDAQTGKM